MITKPPRYNPEHCGARDSADPRYQSGVRVTYEHRRWTDAEELDPDRVAALGHVVACRTCGLPQALDADSLLPAHYALGRVVCPGGGTTEWMDAPESHRSTGKVR